MTDIVAAQDLFMNAEMDAAVTAKSGKAAFLLIRKGRKVPRRYTQFVTKAGNPKQAKKEKTKDPETKEDVAAEDKGSN